jgi:hypothetical protein
MSLRLEYTEPFVEYLKFLEGLGCRERYVQIRIVDIAERMGPAWPRRRLDKYQARAEELRVVDVKRESRFGEGKKPNAYRLLLSLDEWFARRDLLSQSGSERRRATTKREREAAEERHRQRLREQMERDRQAERERRERVRARSFEDSALEVVAADYEDDDDLLMGW